MNKLRRINILVLALLLCLGALNVNAGTGRTGAQPVGILAFSSNDVNQLADIMAQCPANHDCELHFLAYSFVQGSQPDIHSVSDFAKIDQLIRRALPQLNSGQKLFVAVSLDDGSNRAAHPDWVNFKKNMGVTQFWNNVANGSLQTDWQSVMVSPLAQWLNSIRGWAAGRGYAGRLQFVIVPVLEDRAPTLAAYQRLLDWTRQGLPSGLLYRRSSVLSNAARPNGATMEYHTLNAGQPLQSGDAISNDGLEANGTQWQAIQTSCLQHNAAALLWRPEFNGSRNTVPPSQRGELRPFADAAKVQSLINWIKYRPNGL